MALTTKGMFDIKVWDDIKERCNNQDITAIINNRIQLFYPINTEEAVKKFTQVGQLYQLAYSGSKRNGACSVHVVEVLSRYQDLVKNTVIICTTFTNVVLKSLSFHKPALIYAEKGKPNKAIGSLRKCANFAGDMGEQCDKMVIEIEKMVASSIKAFAMVKENFVGSDGEKHAIVERELNLNAHINSSSQRMKDLKEKVENARMEEAKTKDEGKRDIKDKLIYGLLGPISYIGNTKVTSNELKLLLQNEARQVNEDLAGSIESLQKIKYAESEMYACATCLEVAIKILEKVKTMFSNAKQFWIGVNQHCDSLLGSETAQALKDDDVLEVCKEAFVNEIVTSGFGWLAIGKISREAALNIRSVSHGVDRTNTKLFNKHECEQQIQELCSVLLTDIVEENEKIEDVKSDWLYEVLVKSSPLKLKEEEPVAEEKPFNYLVNGTDEHLDGTDENVDGTEETE